MTTAEYLAKKIPNLDDDDIVFLISSATAIYKSITHYDTVLPEHENWILRACIELNERENFTGAKEYTENGISVNYDRTQLSYGLTSELPNNAVMFKKGRGNDMRYRDVFIRPRRYIDGEVVIEDKVRRFNGNIQTPQNFRDIQLYGERISDLKKGIFRNSLVCEVEDLPYPSCVISNGDLAYIETTPNGENEDGDNADYVVKSVITSNAFTEITFEKIQQE